MGISDPIVPIQGSILDGFKNMVWFDLSAAVEVRQSARDFEDAIVSAGRKVHFGHGVVEVLATFRTELAVFPHELGSHVAVVFYMGRFGETFDLEISSRFDAVADGLRRFAGVGGGKVLVLYERYFDVQIDPV